MQYTATSVEDYLTQIPADRLPTMEKLRATILKNLPKGFAEGVGYGIMGYNVPHSLYPAGYHCDPKQPLPFMGIASQKNFIAFYHMGIYANPALLDWFVEEYKKQVPSKLDMGKSCVRFKKMDQIPYDLIGELVKKITVKDWIELYEKAFRKG